MMKMNNTIKLFALVALLGLMLVPSFVLAAPTDAGVLIFDAAAPPAIPGSATPPVDIKDGVKLVSLFGAAIQAKAWWGLSAVAIFLLMLGFKVSGLLTKIGKRWSWVLTGVLTLIASLFGAFQLAGGFSWDVFLGFLTAGPTIAWLRGFVKKAIRGNV
jgi:hypothetical protein